MGQGDSSIVETSRSHSDTPHSVGLLWTGDQPVPDITQHSHKIQTSMPTPEFEPANKERGRTQTYALDRTATGISLTLSFSNKINITAKHGVSITFVVL